MVADTYLRKGPQLLHCATKLYLLISIIFIHYFYLVSFYTAKVKPLDKDNLHLAINWFIYKKHFYSFFLEKCINQREFNIWGIFGTQLEWSCLISDLCPCGGKLNQNSFKSYIAVIYGNHMNPPSHRLVSSKKIQSRKFGKFELKI